MFHRGAVLGLGLVCAVALIGCREQKISSYRVRKEAPPKMPMPPGMADTGAVPKLKWKAPTDWKEEPASGVRVASFAIASPDGKKAELSITQFPGDVGGDLANVNRWRGQLQLPPIGEADLPRFVQTRDLPAGSFSITQFNAENDAAGQSPNSILGAWLKQPERTWFFKLSGDQSVVDAQRNAFIDFLGSLEIVAPAGLTQAGLPSGDSAGADNGPMSNAGAQSVTWTAPADWTAKPLGPMRKGSFSVHGVDGAEADLSIISFPGEAGGVAGNINRWRKQVQLPEESPTDLASDASTLANDGLRFTVVDFLGKTENGPTRIVGAILPLENETYFFKLMGPDAVVSEHKAAFLDFLKTVKVH